MMQPLFMKLSAFNMEPSGRLDNDSDDKVKYGSGQNKYNPGKTHFQMSIREILFDQIN